ncbi:MAG: NAD(P)H-dependent oxidoreductase [Acetobacterium sp.]
MHKILVLNGSPKNEKSYTMKLVECFLSGVSEISLDVNIETINLYEKNIKPCVGGFECWTITPGKCVKEDDMNELLEKYIEADIIIWATPLYYYGITSVMKKFLERTLPLFLPFIDPEGGGIFGHPYRNPEKMENKKHVLISTCAFPSLENNYEGVIKQFDNLFGQEKWEKICCVEGELLGLSQLDNFTGPYLELVKAGGREYITQLSISESIREGLEKPFVDIPAFLEMSNLSWGVDDLRELESDGGLIAWNFMKQMRAAFNPNVRPGLHAVLQMDFTDLKESYQFVIKDNECTLLKNDFTTETTRINTHFTTWERIVEGKIDPAQALMEKKYTVAGDFTLINALVDGLFGSLALHAEKNKKLLPVVFKNTPYWFFLTMIPWLACFILADFNPFLGVIVPLLISGVLFSIKKGSELVYFDKTTILFFSVLTLVTVPWSIGYDGLTIAFSGFMGLFVIWLASAFKTVPLTADYTHFSIGRNALKNGLFLKTNRILTVAWAFLFLFEGLMALWISTTSMMNYAAIIPQILLLPGYLLSEWFGKWYPANRAKPE